MDNYIQLVPYEYHCYCEIPGCSNTATKSITKPGMNGYQKINVCESCLQEIVDRCFDIDILPQKIKKTMEQNPELLTAEELLNRFGVGDVREIAKMCKIQYYQSMKKEDMIKSIIDKKVP